MTLRNPTTVGGKTEPKSAGCKSDSQTTTSCSPNFRHSVCYSPDRWHSGPCRYHRRPLPFDHPEWIFELKYDGFRSIAVIQNGRTQLISRNGNPFKENARSILSREILTWLMKDYCLGFV